MLRRHYKNLLLLSSTILSLLFVAQTHVAKADAAFTLHSVNDIDFPIDADTLAAWKSTNPNNLKYISFEPEQDLNSFVANQLGISSKNVVKVDLNKYNVGEIYKSLKGIEEQINSDPEEAKMEIEDKRVTEFNPGKNGRDLDIKASIDQIALALDEGKTSTDLKITESEPLVKLANTNNLGIKELVAFGESNYSGSPKNRIFNIKVGVGKETGVMLDPGEEFSFNKYLGPVDGEHGFLPELVIKKTGTIPEFGGGLCQVSSTVFRAAMNAGLPITARRNHSYAVSYYSPQGTDATIYPGVQDFKFINDTSGSLLIWPEFVDKNKLRFYLYGTKDTRQVTLDTPTAYDRKPDGSLKAVWHREVTMPDGTVKKDTFNSTYQSPALFHKEETYPAAVNTNIAAPSPLTPKTPQTPTTQ